MVVIHVPPFTCFTYLQWYRQDVRLTQVVHLPAQATQSHASDQRIVCDAMNEMRVDSGSSLSFTSSSSSCASSRSDDECAQFEATLEPPRGVEDPEAREGTGIFVPCSQPHGSAFSQHECTRCAYLIMNYSTERYVRKRVCSVQVLLYT